MTKRKALRPGYTTGACAAAAAKAAVERALGITRGPVEIALPSGERVGFKVKSRRAKGDQYYASVIKDAGDDPDVTNGAEIGAWVALGEPGADITVDGGQGVGRVTRAGLAVSVGNAAINPVPMRMIREAVAEAGAMRGVRVTIVVPHGEEMAKKTLNARLGIIGGISILGTTGIVKPLSTEAWTATISTSFDVAEAAGLDTAVLATGRTSERAHMEAFGLPETAYVMMGDHVEWTLREARKRKFSELHLCAQWAKLVKIAMGTPDTHVRAGAIEPRSAAEFLRGLGMRVPARQYNTVRDIYESLATSEAAVPLLEAARAYAEKESGHSVRVALVGYDGKIEAFI